jgi:hypothetical protein
MLSLVKWVNVMVDNVDSLSTFFRNILITGLGVGLTLLAAFVGFISNKVWENDRILAQQQTDIQHIEVAESHVDHRFELLDTNYQTISVVVQSLKDRDEAVLSAIANVKLVLDNGRADRIREMTELSNRIFDVEKLLSSLHDPYNHSGYASPTK